MIYSVLEQHIDGAWWYHPGYSYDTEEKAKQEADAFSKRFDNRPTMVFSHEAPLPQKHSTCTRNFKTFGIAGGVEWIAKQPGVPIRKYSNGWTAWYIDDHPKKDELRNPDNDLCAYPEESIVVVHPYGPVVVFLETLEDLAVFEKAQKLEIDEE